MQNLKSIHILVAGLIAETCFELYAWLVSPVLFRKSQEPANLVMALAEKFLNLQIPYSAAFAIHFLVGIIVFSTCVYLFHRIVKTPLIWTGVLSGVALWFIAQGILAPVIGRSFMMDFGPYTQSSFIGHVGMTLIVVAVFRFFASRSSDVSRPVEY